MYVCKCVFLYGKKSIASRVKKEKKKGIWQRERERARRNEREDGRKE